MEMNVTKAVFKSQSKKQHAALVARNIELKLSDIQESLAIAYGFANLATLYARFKSEAYSEVDSAPLLTQLDNLFVVTWFIDEDDLDQADEVMGIYPPGTTLEDLNARDPRNRKSLIELNENVRAFPEGMVLSKETVALENYSYVPNVMRNGLHEGAQDSTASQWVKEYFGFRVPKTGVKTGFYDMGDGATKDHILVWLNDEDCEKVRAFFAK